MMTDLIRLGLRYVTVVALFGVGGIVAVDVVQQGHAPVPRVAAPPLVTLPVPGPRYTVLPAEPLPKPVFPASVPPSVPPRVVIITPQPTPSVLKTTAAPKRKPVSRANVYPVPSTSPLVAQAYARTKVKTAQFPCLGLLWNRESGWNVRAYNSSSGAYGIPQALPGTKMATFGADWRTNYRTQINWGLNYISGRYGSPCSAWAHSNVFGWY